MNALASCPQRCRVRVVFQEHQTQAFRQFIPYSFYCLFFVMASSIESFPHSVSSKLMLDTRTRVPANAEVLPSPGVIANVPPHQKNLSFWMVFLAICLSLFLFALEMVSLPFHPIVSIRV